jgi:3-hydroxyacyl-[acyl-carrier-protein] dehydratase
MRLEYFQMLDRVERLDVNEPSLIVAAVVPDTSPVFEGHFPGHPLVPGVLLLETMAQAAGYLMLALNGFSRMPFFANAKEANFRAFVTPGEALTVSARRVHDGSGYAVVDAEIGRDGKRVSDSRLTMRSVPFPSPALERHVRNEGVRLGFLPQEGEFHALDGRV